MKSFHTIERRFSFLLLTFLYFTFSSAWSKMPIENKYNPVAITSSYVDLSLTATSSTQIAAIGDQVTFTLKVTNEAQTVASNVVVKDYLPANITINNISSTAGTFAQTTNEITWNIGNITSNTNEVTLTIIATLNTSGGYYNRAEIFGLTEPDLDSTPNNNNILEDDIAASCATIPYKYCNGEVIQISLTAPTGYSNYQWFKNNQPITNATQESYTITEIGSYTFTVGSVQIGTNCQASPCCPIIVERYNTLTITPTITDVSCFGGNNGNILINTSGSTGVLQYNLNNGAFQSNNTFSNLIAGNNYLITVKDANGCLATSSVVITEPSKLTASGSAGTILCNGDKTTITASGNGGTGIYTYLINGTAFQSGATFANIGAGTYTITVKDANGCLATSSLTITEPSKLTASGIAGIILCNGDKTTITASGNGGTGTYTYSINGTAFQSGATFTNIGAGTYTITVKDGNGCLATSNVTVSEPSKLVASASAGTILCNGDKTTITASGIGGTGTYTYSINGTVFQSRAIFTNIGAGTYTITVKDVNGCLATSSITVTEPSKLTASASAGTVLCNGDKTTITAIGNGGTGIYTYSINGTVFQNGATFANIGAGTYTITVKDANGCLATSSLTITEPSKLTASAIAGTILCNGDKTTITAIGNGGTGTYSYSINGTVFQNGAIFTNIGAGTYTIMVKDANGCLATSSLTITEPSKLIASGIAGTILCNGDKTTITTNGNGGTGIYTYSINGTVFQSGAIFTNIGSGTYTITVKDANGCLATSSLTITEPNKLIASGSSAGTILCSGDKTTITAIGNGGTGIYTYSINGTVFQNGATFANIGAGTYTITVKDVNGCLATSSVTVSEPSKLTASASAGTILCNVDKTTITAIGNGGTGIYTYSINGTVFQNGATFANIGAGTYTITVKDANGCLATSSLTITEPSKLIASGSAGTILCNGDKTTITASGNGGTGIYTYSINGTVFQSGAIFTNIGSGTYTITVKDANGCLATSSLTITEPSKLIASGSAGTILCNGDKTTITASGNGGTGIYTYSINGTVFQSGASFTNIGSGTYTITVKDANGCLSTSSVVITEPSKLTASASAGTILCNGDKTTITASGNGGTGIYTYSINGTVFQSGASFTNIGAGTYTITVKDANGCLATSNITVTEPSKLIASANAGTILCNGEKTTITASGNGGTGIYTYSINGTVFQSGASFTNIGAGTYTITVKDANGCLATSSITVTEPSKLIASANAGTILCNGDKTTITASGNGGTGTYTYSINGTVFQSGASFTNIGAGTYTITVKDANGCLATSSITVTEPSKLTASGSAGTILCNGDKTTITASGNGGTGIYTYSINGTVFQSGAIFTNIGAGTYTITVKDANGCLSTSSVVITEPSKLTASGSAGTILCNGDKTTITASGNGGTGIYTYSINGMVFQSGASFTNIGSGTYTITVKDANGCLSTSSVVITEPSKLTASGSAGTILCNGDKTTITASGNGGIGIYTYSINGTIFQSGASFTNIGAGTYTITVKDANGCLSTSSVVITEPSKLTASGSAGTILCNGDKTTITASGNGGTGIYTYSINGTAFQSGANFTNIGAGTYTITVKDANGCLATSSVVITEPSKFFPTISSNTPICSGESILLSTSTGVSFIWTGPNNFSSTSQSPVIPSATIDYEGIYRVVVSNSLGCVGSATTSVTIKQLDKLISSNVNICEGQNLTLTSPDYGNGATYQWNGPNNFTQMGRIVTINNITTLLEGLYTIIVEKNGCSVSATVSVDVKQKPVPPVITADKVLCSGNTVTLSASSCLGGNIIWSNGLIGTSISVSSTGTFSAVCKVEECLSNNSNIIVLTNGISPTAPLISSDKLICCDGASAKLIASGCNGVLSWSTGVTASSINVSTSGSYTAICSNNCGSSSSSNVIVIRTGTSPTAPVISSNKTGLCDTETAILSATGCNGSVKWSTNSTGTSITVSSAGTYSAVCENICGVSGASNIIIINTGSSPAAPIISSNKTSLCNTETAILTATGCNGTLKWSTNATGTSITVSSAGTYSAVCENICGVSGASNIIAISTGSAPATPVISSDKLICCDGASAKLIASGCNGVLSWSTGVTASSISVSTSGSYTAICSNNCGSSSSSNVIVIRTGTSPTAPVISSNKTSLCNTETAILTATGCNGSVKWSTNATGTSITLSSAGTYSAVCENICGVSGASNVIIINTGSSPAAPIISSNKTSLCNTETAILTATGCNGSLKWSTNATGTSITVSSAGTYSVVCENICGVSGASNIITISTGSAPATPVISSDKLICCDGASAKLTASGCNGVLSWSTGVTASSISVSTSGSYTAICSNNCGSSSSSNVIVIRTGTSPTAPVISSNKTSLCNTETAILSATGCSGSVKWSTNATGTSITVSSAGTYSAVCENICGVSGASNIITINTGLSPVAPIISANKTSICNTETATLTASGCNGTVKWITNATGTSITVSNAGTYTAKCTDVGCGESGASNQIVITTGSAPVSPIISASKVELCGTESAILTASGCNGTIKWSTGATTSTISISVAGTLTTTCKNSCGESGNSNAIIIKKTDLPVAPSVSANSTNICGTEKANLVANGCAGIVTWSTGATGTVLFVSAAGTYTATCTNICGESSVSQGVVIRQGNSPAAPIISSNKMSVCSSEKATLISLGCSGTIIWSTGATGTSIQVSAGTYTATCVNACGVSGSSNVVNITNGGTPTPPTINASKTNICGTETVTLTASNCSGTVKWNNATTGTSISVNSVGTYSAICSNSCGESMPSNVIAISKGSNSTAPVIKTSKNNICAGEEITLSATGCTNGTIIWTGLNQSGTSIKVIPFTTNTYSAICTQVCDSPAGSIVINVQNSGNLIVTGPKDAVCAGTEITLKASGCVGMVSWSNGATGSEIKVIANETKTYSALCGSSTILCDFKEGTVSFNKAGGSTGTGITTKYLLLSTNGNILQVQDSPAFNNVKSGNYLASAITYTSNVTGLTLGLNISNVTGSCVSRTEKQFSVCSTESLGCKSSGEINITVLKKPNAPTIISNKTTICGDEKATLTAAGCTGAIVWSTGATGTNIQVSVGTYSATCSNACGVSGASNIVFIEKGGTVSPPTISTNKTNLCGTETAMLTATGCAGTILWSNSLTGLSITVNTSGTYTAKCTGVGCGESGTSNQIVIKTGFAPSSPIISSSKIALCSTETATLTASGCSDSIKWNTGATASSITISNSGTYTAICTNTCGESGNSNAIVISKTVVPASPLVTSDKTNLCGTETAILTASGCTGIIAWSTSATGTAITVSTVGTYTATCNNICGESEPSQGIVINKGFSPAAPIISSDKMSVCKDEKATLMAMGCHGTITWSTGSTGTNLQVGSGTYTATCMNACGVSGSSNIVNIANGGTPTPPITVADKTSICVTETATLTSSSCFGVITWNTGTTGSTLTVSSAGTYSAVCKNDCGTSLSSQIITIISGGNPTAPSITTSQTQICNTETATLTVSNCSGIITWNTGATGSSIVVSTIGTYSATCKNTCGTSEASIPVVITAKSDCGGVCNLSSPVVTASKIEICKPENIILTATGCGSKIVWSNGATGTSITVKPFANTSYYAVCTDGNKCTSLLSNVINVKIGTITVPTVSCSTDLVCAGESVTLKAYNCEGTVVWSTGVTGNTLTVSPTQNTSYTAHCKIGDCLSQETNALSISVGLPNKPFIYCTKNTLCASESTTLTASGCSGIVEWSTGQTGAVITVSPITEKSVYSAVCRSIGGKCTSEKSNEITITVGKKVEEPKVITVLKNICPFNTADLNNAILTEPSTTNGQFEFHISSSPNSSLLTNIGSVETGKYWVFERSTIGCYSDGIMIEVKTDTCNGGVTPPTSKVDVAVRKTGSASVVPVGEKVTYTVVVKNVGTTKATGIVIRDILPNGLSLEQNSTNSTFSNGLITAKIDSLKSGDSTIFTYTTKVTALGKIVNKAELFKIDQVDTILSNNSSEFTINNPTVGDLIGLAKTVGEITKVSDKVFDVPFTLNVVNLGGTDLSNIQVSDDLDRAFGNGVKILGDSIKVTADSGLVVNSKFSGRTSNINLLIDNKSTIKKGERKAIKFTVRVDMTNATTNKFFNSADVTSGSLKDKSTDGFNPDPDGDGNPNNNDEPTPITISTGSSNTDSIGVGVALSVLDSNRTNSTCWNVTYMAIIKNTGKALLKNVRLTDSLKKCYGDSVDFKIVGKINLSKNSKLKVNPTFNGVDDVDILIADTTSQIGIGVQDTLIFTINICNGYVTKTYKNQITVKAIAAGNVVSDISNDGKIVDKNVDSPTYVTLTKQTGMMIPDGFSPNGDGKNDNFIIRLDNGSKLESCNIYNRWGELVFHDTESMNTLTTIGWDGTSNTGIRFGKEGLPDGTYYYAVKVAGETNMRIGFLTLAR